MIIKKRWLASCLFFFLWACERPSTNSAEAIAYANRFYAQVDSVKPLVSHGDLIFRNGTDEVSAAARSMNRIDTSYSHCGLVLVENDTPFVYHMIGGHFNPSQKLRRDLIDSFLVPGETDRFAIYRYDLAKRQTDSLSAVVNYHYRTGLEFDLYFNFLSDDKMYCSEFVFKCLNRALSDSLSQVVKAREWPYGISPDDLFLNKKSRLITKVEF